MYVHNHEIHAYDKMSSFISYFSLQSRRTAATRLAWSLDRKLLMSVANLSNYRYGIPLAKNDLGKSTLGWRMFVEYKHDLVLLPVCVRSVTRSYYRGAAGALLVYDVTSRDSFNVLSNWLNDARTLASPNICVLLVGNKRDLDENREVTFLEASRFAQENGKYTSVFLSRIDFNVNNG